MFQKQHVGNTKKTEYIFTYLRKLEKNILCPENLTF